MEYKIIGTTVPAVELKLNRGESVYCQKGGMAWMSDTMQMQTNTQGGLFNGVARMISGESFFMNTYTAQEDNATIAFATAVPGSIVALDVEQGTYYAQKGSFLAAEQGVQLGATFTRRIAAGLFGGEGIILQSLTGRGSLVSYYEWILMYKTKARLIKSAVYKVTEEGYTLSLAEYKARIKCERNLRKLGQSIPKNVSKTKEEEVKRIAWMNYKTSKEYKENQENLEISVFIEKLPQHSKELQADLLKWIELHTRKDLLSLFSNTELRDILFKTTKTKGNQQEKEIIIRKYFELDKIKEIEEKKEKEVSQILAKAGMEDKNSLFRGTNKKTLTPKEALNKLGVSNRWKYKGYEYFYNS